MTFLTLAVATAAAGNITVTGRVVCGLKHFNDYSSVECSGNVSQDANVDGSADMFFNHELMLDPTTECTVWDDLDNDAFSIKDQKLCDIESTYDTVGVRLGDDCSAETLVVTWGNNGGGAAGDGLAHGPGTSGGTPNFVADVNGNPIKVTDIDGNHQTWVFAGNCGSPGGWGSCGPDGASCGDLEGPPGSAYASYAIDTWTSALGYCNPDFQIYTTGEATLIFDGLDYMVTGEPGSTAGRRETIQNVGTPGTFVTYTSGIYWQDLTLPRANTFLVDANSFDMKGGDGGSNHWCFVGEVTTTEGGGTDDGFNDVVTAGLNRGVNTALGHQENLDASGAGDDSSALAVAWDSAEYSGVEATDCAVAQDSTWVVDSAGVLMYAGMNKNSQLGLGSGASLTARDHDFTELAPPSGYGGWIEVVAQGTGVCGLAVVSMGDTTGDVFCWGGMGTGSSGIHDWGYEPTLWLEDISTTTEL